MAGRWEAGMQCRRVKEKAPNKHLLYFLIISNYNHILFLFFFLRWVERVVERRRLWVQIISLLLNNINNSFGPGDVFIVDFQAHRSTYSKWWQKNESECVGIKHLNSLLPGRYIYCHILHLPPLCFCWFDFIYISSLYIQSLF